MNDSYWLLAPLKVRDRGVKVEAGGPKDLNGATCETLRLKFDKVGLTPTDQYVFYIDPKTKLPLAWDYIPAVRRRECRRPGKNSKRSAG